MHAGLYPMSAKHASILSSAVIERTCRHMAQDFYDLTWAYLKRAAADRVVHAEIFFDPQTHTGRDVPFGTALQGISEALAEAKTKLGISSHLIMCFLRHLGPESAMTTLHEVCQPDCSSPCTLQPYCCHEPFLYHRTLDLGVP